MEWAHLEDPKYWTERADEACYVAERITDAASREMMFQIAAAYERLAKRAKERQIDPSA
jgi:hypothetical protein